MKASTQDPASNSVANLMQKRKHNVIGMPIKRFLASLLVLALSVFLADILIVRWSTLPAPGVVTKAGVHIECLLPERRKSDTLVVFHHGEVGSFLQFRKVQRLLQEQGVASCSYDRPGYGFSSTLTTDVNTSTSSGVVHVTSLLLEGLSQAITMDVEAHPFEKMVHVAHGSGAAFAWSACRKIGNNKKKKTKGPFGLCPQVVLVDPILTREPLSDTQFSEEWRQWLNRPLDNQFLMVSTGFGRLLNVFGAFGAWHGEMSTVNMSATEVTIEKQLVLDKKHVGAIRREMYWDLWDRCSLYVPLQLKKSIVDVLSIRHHDAAKMESQEATGPNPKSMPVVQGRVKSALLSIQGEEKINFHTISGQHFSVTRDAAEKIVQLIKA